MNPKTITKTSYHLTNDQVIEALVAALYPVPAGEAHLYSHADRTYELIITHPSPIPGTSPQASCASPQSHGDQS